MSHKLGQVFLKDQNILDKIIELADIKPTDIVVEIGCGQGWLSKRLADRCHSLTIIELDPTYLAETQERLSPYTTIQYIHQDALTVSYDQLHNRPYKIVTNLPYYISAKFMQKIIHHRDHITHATIMLQDEFAKKLIAPAGSSRYCSLGLYSQFYYTIDYAFKVSKHCFRPVPKIDSAVIQCTPRTTPLYTVDEDLFFSITKSAFWGRRKPIQSALKKSPFFSWKSAYESLDIWSDLKGKRGETMHLDDFYYLYQQIANSVS